MPLDGNPRDYAAPTVRSAILRTADHIEQHPELFKFIKSTVPECGTPGCLLGWIGHFLGMTPGRCISELKQAMNADDTMFYKRLDLVLGGGNWCHNALMCVRGLRLYADAFHKESVHAL